LVSDRSITIRYLLRHSLVSVFLKIDLNTILNPIILNYMMTSPLNMDPAIRIPGDLNRWKNDRTFWIRRELSDLWGWRSTLGSSQSLPGCRKQQHSQYGEKAAAHNYSRTSCDSVDWYNYNTT